MTAQTFKIDGREFRYTLKLSDDGVWKPEPLEGHYVVPGDAMFESYEEARKEARRRNRLTPKSELG